MTGQEIWALVVGAVQGVVGVSVFLIILLIGFCIALDLTKFRKRGPASLVIRSLDEKLGEPATYLPPNAPRGPSDQLAGSQSRQ